MSLERTGSSTSNAQSSEPHTSVTRTSSPNNAPSASFTPSHAYPSESEEEGSAQNASATTTPPSPTSPPSQSTAAQHASAGRSRSSSLTRIGSRIASLRELVLPDKIDFLGVSAEFAVQPGGGQTLSLKIARAGYILVAFHLFLIAIALFGLASDIMNWISNKQSDATFSSMHSMLDRDRGLLANLSTSFSEWKNGQHDECTPQDEEQRRWDALFKVFEECGSLSSRTNTTLRCDNVLDHFKTVALPRPDRSSLAKRNIAKLERIIHQQHYSVHPYVQTRFEQAYSLASIAAAIALMIYALAVFFNRSGLAKQLRGKTQGRLRAGLNFSFWRWRRRPALRNGKSYEPEEASSEKDRDHVPMTSGVDVVLRQPVQRRGHKVPDIYATAARKGALQDLRRIVQSTPNFNVNNIPVSKEYGTLLIAAARSGDIHIVRFVLSLRPSVNEEGGRYLNALQAAAHSGSDEVVQLLLGAGARENSSGGFYGTSVNAAAENCSVSTVALLLAETTSDDHLATLGGTYGYPIIAAAARGDMGLVNLLLNNRASVQATNASGSSAIHEAAAHGHDDVLELLLSRDRSTINVAATGRTPLHLACINKHESTALKLLEFDAETPIVGADGRTALHEASKHETGFEEFVSLVLSRNPELKNAVDVNKNTPLHLASISGNRGIVRALLQYGADCGMGDSFLAQPLFRAAGCEHPNIVYDLLSIGHADPNAADVFGRTALHGPAQTSDVSVHEHLIAFGADVNVVGSDKKTPLHEACNMGRIENVRLLVKQPNIKLNELDSDGFTALYRSLCSTDGRYSDECKDPEIPKILLEQLGTDVNAAQGLAIQEAARKGYIDLVKDMVEKREARIDVLGSKYGSVLQAAVISGKIELVEYLLNSQHSVRINAVGGEYGSALAAAAAFGYEEIVDRLLEAGADPTLQSGGRYGSAMLSIGKLVPQDRARRPNAFDVSIPIRASLIEYGAAEDGSSVDSRDRKDWRWKNLTSGWGWQRPGEM